MLKTLLSAVALMGALMLPSTVLAHPGHNKKVLGTVTMAAADHVMVKTADGKEQTIAINAQTRVVRGKTALKVDTLTVGTRVVITLTAKEPPTAAQIEVGPANPQTKK
jgi:hypothetical protein